MVKLRDALIETRTVEVQTKPELWAYVCDGCGALFRPQQEGEHCKMWGRFKDLSTTAQGYMSSNFYARVCSFDCVAALYSGGWEKLAQFRPYAEVGARLAYAEAKITPVNYEADLVEQWEEQ